MERSKDLITQAAYARLRKERGLPGGTRKAVHAAVRDGSIDTFTDDKLIDPDLADRQWAQNRRARVSAQPPGAQQQQRQDLATTGRRGRPATAQADDDGRAAGRDEPAPPTADNPTAPDYSTSRARREAAEAERAELSLAHERGELIAVAAVQSVLASTLSATRDGLLQIPSRLAAVVAAEGDAAKVHELLRAEIEQALQQLAAAPDRLTTGGAVH